MGVKGKFVLVLRDVLVPDLEIFIYSVVNTDTKLWVGDPEFDLYNGQTGSGMQPASSSMGNGSSFVGSKAAGECI